MSRVIIRKKIKIQFLNFHNIQFTFNRRCDRITNKITEARKKKLLSLKKFKNQSYRHQKVRNSKTKQSE